MNVEQNTQNSHDINDLPLKRDIISDDIIYHEYKLYLCIYIRYTYIIYTNHCEYNTYT